MKVLVVCVIALVSFSSTVDSVPRQRREVYGEVPNEQAGTTLSPVEAIAVLQKQVTDHVVSLMKSLGDIKVGANQKVIDAEAAVKVAKEAIEKAKGTNAEEAAKSKLNETEQALRAAKVQDEIAKRAYKKAKEDSTHIWFEF